VDIYSFAPVATVLDLAYSVVSTLASSLDPLTGGAITQGAGAALAVVLITLALRTLLIPVGVSQVRAEATRRRLAPRLADLRRRFATKPELLQRKMLELYTSEKASPLAGILPTLAQAPVLSLVYGLFILPTVNGHPNALLAEHLFGVPLGDSFAHLVAAGSSGLVVPLALLLVVAAVSYLARRAALRFAVDPLAAQPATAEQLAAQPLASRGAPDVATPAARRLAAALSWLPFITVLFAALVPLAAALYLTVTTTWTLVERSLLRRRLLPA
jgi:YidC/Oxa1 family membrane protein insertase